jgi:hypothetical protein
VRKDTVANLTWTIDIGSIMANVAKRAGHANVSIPPDVALYVEQTVGSNERDLRTALVRLVTHSWITGTEITLASTQRVLKKFIDAEARKSTVDPIQNLLYQNSSAKEARVRPEHCVAADSHLFLCLQKTRNGRKASGVRLELEVNMRESEREQLARRDAYERDFERRGRKRIKAESCADGTKPGCSSGTLKKSAAEMARRKPLLA